MTEDTSGQRPIPRRPQFEREPSLKDCMDAYGIRSSRRRLVNHGGTTATSSGDSTSSVNSPMKKPSSSRRIALQGHRQMSCDAIMGSKGSSLKNQLHPHSDGITSDDKVRFNDSCSTRSMTHSSNESYPEITTPLNNDRELDVDKDERMSMSLKSSSCHSMSTTMNKSDRSSRKGLLMHKNPSMRDCTDANETDRRSMVRKAPSLRDCIDAYGDRRGKSSIGTGGVSRPTLDDP